MSSKMIREIIAHYPVQIVLNIVLGFSGALFNGVGTTLLVPVLLSFLGQEIAFQNAPPLIQSLITPFHALPSQYQLAGMAGVIVVIILLKNLATYASALASSALSRAITADLQEQGLRLLLEVDLDFFAKAKAGDLMNRLGGEMSRTSTTISAAIGIVITAITILVFVGILLAISCQLTLAATFLLPISTFASQHLISRSKELGKQITQISQHYSGGLIEVFSGIRLVKATGNELVEYQRFQQLIRDRERVEFQTRVVSAMIAPINETTNIVVLFSLILLCRFLFADQLGTLLVDFLTYLLVLSRLLPFIAQLNGFRSSLARSAASVDIVQDLLRRDNKSFMVNGSRPYQGFQQDIRFEHLSFAYPDTELVLREIDLSLPKGTTLALVGASGAGKSTLADLLPRFYDPIEGKITIDGVDLREFEIKSVRQAMGIVSQDTFLFNDSLRNNITYGCPTVTESALLDVVRRANAHEFIERLPRGLETLIGDRGVMLSGGQRQRIAIARALLRNPDILILDEATSALDTVSERLVQQALDELSRERTTLVIAHRLSTIQKADQIAVMEKGRVVERGTHAELLKQNGAYSRLYSMQFAEQGIPLNPIANLS
ncbi:MAG: ABC transporter ATP-binding protein [Leptolyngbyaceae cyanobacterium SL_7_1]|nr:ABC transporter ATP-binding protein [Leptolyngbyaceae cyanobacterium SL_7_1]